MVLVPLLAFAALASVQDTSCSAAQHRQFDFWIGEWNVTDRRGQLIGTSRVERQLNGCAISESWEGTNGTRGQSTSAWDPGDNTWRQSWRDEAGMVLVIAGGIINGEMVMEGERRMPDGTQTLERITWTPNKDGTVRQVWTSSPNRGMRWTSVFDAIYSRISEPSTTRRRPLPVSMSSAPSVATPATMPGTGSRQGRPAAMSRRLKSSSSATER